MNKLTRQEAQDTIMEAYRLKGLYRGSRLGQAIWWCYGEISNLPEEIKEKLSMYGIKPRVIDDNNR